MAGAESELRAVKTDSERLILARWRIMYYIRVSEGALQNGAVKKVQPAYPAEAKAARVYGAVKIRVLISEEGNVIEAEVLEGPDLLREPSLAAARMWVFRPTELSGKPVKMDGELTFNFTLR